MTREFHIDDSYREDVTLRDGTRVRLRAVTPSDKKRLAGGLEKLSVESQHGRFFSPKSHFTDQELHYLTEVDGIDHFAVGAVGIERRRKEGAGLGISRFVRLPEEPEVAEAAVAVIDEMQNRGIGRLLLERLVVAAVERGVKRFRCQMLAKNNRIRNMIMDGFPDAQFDGRGTVVVAEFPLPERLILSHGGVFGSDNRLAKLLHLAARRLVRFLPGSALMKHAKKPSSHDNGSQGRPKKRESGHAGGEGTGRGG